MAHIKKENLAEKMFDLAVYVIVSPFSKEIFISFTPQKRIYKTYSEHYTLKNKKTVETFVRSKNGNLLPAIYVLDFSKMTKEEAFRRSVAWTRYFLDHDYKQMKEDRLGEYSVDLVSRTQIYYDQIKDTPIEDVLQPEGGLFPNYGNVRKKSSEDPGTVVTIKLEPEEYEEIKKKSEEQGLSLSAYCRRITLNGKIVRVDVSFIRHYIDEFADSKRLLKQILFTIYSTKKYYPADLENIQRCIDQLAEMQKNVSAEMTDTLHKLREQEL